MSAVPPPITSTPPYSACVATKTQAELGESPLWDRRAGLRWLDIPARRLHTLGLDGEETTVDLDDTVTSIAHSDRDNDLAAVTSTGFGWLNPHTGQVEQVAITITDETITMNDGCVDPRGRYWAGSAVRDDSYRGALYRLEGTVATTHVDRIGMSNGIDWSPDGNILYHTDSTAGTVKAWTYHPATGELGDSRILVTVAEQVGLPDGLTVAADGTIWLAVWGTGQVWQLDPHDGHTLAMVEVPTPYTTSCAFGGPDLSTLYVTTANHQEPPGGGLLYAVDVPVRGRLPHTFTRVAG